MNRTKSLLSIATILSTFLFQQQANAEGARINAGTSGTDNSKPAAGSGYAPNRDPIVRGSSYSGVGDSGRRETGTTGVKPAK